MDHLEERSVEELQHALDNVDGKKPTQRLLAAIAYKHGVTQTELAEWYGVERRTIYSWLKRLDTDGALEHAVEDAHRSGRPRKLSEAQRAQLEDVLHGLPSDVGYDASAWTPSLVRTYLKDTHGVEYSVPSCRRLMKEAGLRYRQSRRSGVEAGTAPLDGVRDEREADDGDWVPR